VLRVPYGHILPTTPENPTLDRGHAGDLKNAPEVSCVYHSEEAENQYLKGWMSKDTGSAGAQAPSPAAGGPAD